jgi:hypothetical protein
MNATPEFIREQPKGRFAVYVKGTTNRALSLKVPFFTMENMSKMTKEEQSQLLDRMRSRYATHYSAAEKTETAPEAEKDDIVESEAPPEKATEEIRPSDEL